MAHIAGMKTWCLWIMGRSGPRSHTHASGLSVKHVARSAIIVNKAPDKWEGKTVCVRCHPDTAQAMRERAEWRAQNAAPRVPNPEWWASSAAESATVAYARNAQAAQNAQNANAIEDEEDHDDIEPDDEPEDDETL